MSRSKKLTKSKMVSITRMLFITTQVSALVWVFISYGIAVYSTVKLQQVYTMAELSEPAIHTILGVGILKVLENIFIILIFTYSYPFAKYLHSMMKLFDVTSLCRLVSMMLYHLFCQYILHPYF